MDNKNIVIHLIREELRSSKLLYALGKLGFDRSPYTLDLGFLIFKFIGLEKVDDNLYDWYTNTLFEYIEGLDLHAPLEVYQEHALNFYIDLITEIKTRNNNDDDVGGAVS